MYLASNIVSRCKNFKRFSDVAKSNTVYLVSTANHSYNVFAFVLSLMLRFVDQIQICPQYKLFCLSILLIRRPLLRSSNLDCPLIEFEIVLRPFLQFTTSKSTLQQVIICSVLRLEPLSTIQGCFNRVYVLAHAQTKSTILGYQVDSCMV